MAEAVTMGGRRRKARQYRRSVLVQFRATPGERQALHRHAKRRGLDTSEWLRALALEAAGYERPQVAS